MELKTTGYNEHTFKNLLLDAGAIYKNFDETLMTGTLVGATQGGNSFSAVPNMRNIPVDGVKSEYVKGLTVIDDWVVTLTTNLLEVNTETIALALGTSKTEEHDESYDSIEGNNYIEETDYLENIAYVGKMSGSNKPIIIIVKNALNHGGIQITTEDKNEGKLPVTFHGHLASDDLESPPFKILYPKTV